MEDSVQGEINPYENKENSILHTATTEDKVLLAFLPEYKEAYFERLAQDFLERIYRFVAGLVDTKIYKKNDIEDIVSITFIKFMTMIHNKKDEDLKSLTINHHAYLCVIARNTYFDDSRRRRRFAVAPPPPENTEGGTPTIEETLVDENVSDEQQWRLSLQEVSKTIDAMRPPYQEVFQLMRDKDLNEAEIAERLQRNINTVKAQIRRGRAILRKNHPDLFEGIRRAFPSPFR